MGFNSGFKGLKSLGGEVDHTSLHLVPSMRVGGAIPPLPLHASIAWIGIALRFTFQNKNFPPELQLLVDSSWNVMAHGEAREGKWRKNWRMKCVASTLHSNMVYPALLLLMCTPRLPVVDWTDATRRFKWTRPFRRKTKSGFCACAITFQTQSNTVMLSFCYYTSFQTVSLVKAICKCLLTA